jgi:hypothetical protein
MCQYDGDEKCFFLHFLRINLKGNMEVFEKRGIFFQRIECVEMLERQLSFLA